MTVSCRYYNTPRGIFQEEIVDLLQKYVQKTTGTELRRQKRRRRRSNRQNPTPKKQNPKRRRRKSGRRKTDGEKAKRSEKRRKSPENGERSRFLGLFSYRTRKIQRRTGNAGPGTPGREHQVGTPGRARRNAPRSSKRPCAPQAAVAGTSVSRRLRAVAAPLRNAVAAPPAKPWIRRSSGRYFHS